MIRRVFRAAPFVAGIALSLPAFAAQAAPGLQDFPRASPVRNAGGLTLVSAFPALSATENGTPLQMASLDATLAYGGQAAQLETTSAAAPQALVGESSPSFSSDALPLLGGLACIAAFVLARRARN